MCGLLRSARKAIDFTQQEVASAVGVSLASYHAWESGKTVPYARHRRRLAEVLGIALGDLREALDAAAADANPFTVDHEEEAVA